MGDKLLVEIELLNDKAEDAVFALIYLLNTLAESPGIHLRDDWDWDQYSCENYRLKWRFAETETQEAWIAPRRTLRVRTPTVGSS